MDEGRFIEERRKRRSSHSWREGDYQPQVEGEKLETQSLIVCPYRDEWARFFWELVGQLKRQYDAEDKPHYQVLIQRVATDYIELARHDAGLTAFDSKDYERRQNDFARCIDQLMRYTETTYMQYSLREAQTAQEHLLHIIKEQLCDECLSRLTSSLPTS